MARSTQTSTRQRRHSRGFSLLEMVVAVAILGISLAALYEAVGGATRIVRVDQKYAYGVDLAQSLVANYSVVPTTGLRQSGSTAGGFRWLVEATPVPLGEGAAVPEGGLQNIRVQVSWADGEQRREVTLHSVVAGYDGEEGFL